MVYLCLCLLFVPWLYEWVVGFVQAPNLGYLSRSAMSLLPVAAVGFGGYRLVAGYFNVAGVADPVEITQRIKQKVCWLVRPGAIEVFYDSTTGDPRRRSAADGASESGSVRVDEITADSLRTILAMEVAVRRGVRGRVLDLTARRDGKGGVAASMFMVTTASAADMAKELLSTVHEAFADDGAAQPVQDAMNDPSEPIVQIGLDEIVVSGSPFEPKLLADARDASPATGRLMAVGVALFAGGLACAIWGSSSIKFFGGILLFIGFSVIVNSIYARYRSSPSRWIATPGSLRIERFTRLIPLLGPKVRTIPVATFGGVRVAQRRGVPVLEVREVGKTKPCAILVPDDLRGREPAELAQAVDAMVRRST